MGKKLGSDGSGYRPGANGPKLGNTVRKEPLVSEERNPQMPVESSHKPPGGAK